jgi:hypothetical protein
MKKLLIAGLLSISALAQASTLSIECYAFNFNGYYTMEILPQYGEIYVTDKAGNTVVDVDAISYSSISLESFPPQTSTTFVDEEGETVVTMNQSMGNPATAKLITNARGLKGLDFNCQFVF